MKRSLFVSALFAASLSLTGLAQALELKISHVRPQGATIDNDLKDYAAAVEKASNGDVKLKIFAASALGNYTTVQEKISVGAVDMACQPAAAGADRRMQISYFPYLAKDYTHAQSLYGKGGSIQIHEPEHAV